MKKSIIIFSIVFIGSLSLIAQVNDTIHENPPDSSIIAGEFNRLELQTGDFGSVFLEEYRKYNVNNDLLNAIENHIYQYSITIVLGTWCGDSKEQIPRFYKILDKLDYNTENVGLIGVDKSKMAGDTDISSLNIELVPTFIFYKDGNEHGRIIEIPNLTLEKDILSIVSE